MFDDEEEQEATLANVLGGSALEGSLHPPPAVYFHVVYTG